MATIKDVARLCGVSAMTVSHVLNKTATIRQETRERVLAAVDELDYHPSAFARGLQGKRSNIVGLSFANIVEGTDGIRDSYQSLLLDSLIVVAAKKDSDVILFSRRQLATEPVQKLRNSGICDGVMLVSPRRDSTVVSSMIRAEFPFVVVSDVVDDPAISCFDIDNRQAAKLAVSHLIDRGHKRILALHFAPMIGCNAPRIAGYRDALEAAGIPFREDYLMEGKLPEWHDDCTFEEKLVSLFEDRENRRPTAIFCFADAYAVYCMELLARLGLCAPVHYSVIGINDEVVGRLASPQLTTIRQPVLEIGRRAAETLFEIIEGSLVETRRELFPCELVERGTVGAVQQT